MKLVLPDTNILIPALAKIDPYASFLRETIKDNYLVLSVIVIAEFLVKATDEEERIFNALLSKTNVLPVDLPVAQLGALYRKRAIGRGKKIALPDCFIAATCKIYNLTLVTLNRRDYPFAEIEVIDQLSIS